MKNYKEAARLLKSWMSDLYKTDDLGRRIHNVMCEKCGHRNMLLIDSQPVKVLLEALNRIQTDFREDFSLRLTAKNALEAYKAATRGEDE